MRLQSTIYIDMPDDVANTVLDRDGKSRTNYDESISLNVELDENWTWRGSSTPLRWEACDERRADMPQSS